MNKGKLGLIGVFAIFAAISLLPSAQATQICNSANLTVITDDNATIRLHPSPSGIAIAVVNTDQNGIHTFENLAAGNYQLAAYNNSPWVWQSVSICSEDVALEITLREPYRFNRALPQQRVSGYLEPEGISIPPTVDPLELALAMDIPSADILNASIGTSDLMATGIGDSPLGIDFPLKNATFSILATGLAEKADDPDTNNDEEVSIGNPNDDVTGFLTGLKNSAGHDLVQFTLELVPPPAATGLNFDFSFFSEEFPDYIGSDFNDTFLAEIGPEGFASQASISGNMFNSSENFAFDPNDDVISINAAYGFNPAFPNPDTETTYDGSSGLLRATGCLPENYGNHIVLILSITDMGDSVLDSAVFLDNFQWGYAEDCTPGVVPVAGLKIEKNPETQTIYTGQTAHFTIRLSNTGNVTLNNITVSDPLTSSCAHSTINGLAPSAVFEYSCQAVGVTSSFTNVATVTGTSILGTHQSSDSAVVDVQPLPTVVLNVTKIANPTSLSEPGGAVTFTVRVENQSLLDIVTLTSLSDDIFGDLNGQGTCSTPQTLLLNAAYECSFTANVIGNAGFVHTNIVSVSGTGSNGGNALETDEASVTITDIASSIAITKTANPTSLPEPGGAVAFTIRVENTSAIDTLTLNSLSDDIYGNLHGQGTCLLPQTLAVSEVYECSFSGDVTGTSGFAHKNTVTVSATDDDSTIRLANASATVTINGSSRCPNPDPRVHLSATIANYGANQYRGYIYNNSTDCTYDVGMAAYQEVDDVLEHQILYSSATAMQIAPGETILSVETVDCAMQLDVFFDASHLAVYPEYSPADADLPPLVLPEFGRTDLYGPLGGMYGPRLLASRHINDGQWCGTLTDTDSDTVPDEDDNCSTVPNTDQVNFDGDEFGDMCDPDIDNDNSLNELDCNIYDPTVYPNAPEIPNDAIDQDCDGEDFIPDELQAPPPTKE